MRLRFLWIAFFAILLLASFSLAAETRLLCLNQGETVRFSQCNPLIADRACTSSLGCQYCTSYNPITSIYCPSSLNLCNSIADLSCSSLNQDIPPSDTGNNTNNTGNNTNNDTSGNSSIDVAYILINPSSPQANVIRALNELHFTYDLIDDNNIPTTNFSDYSLIIVWDERISNANLVPITQKKSLIANTYYLSNWKIAESAGAQISSQYAQGQIMLENSITSGFSALNLIKLYSSTSKELNYLSKLPKRATGIQNVLATTDPSHDVVIGIIEKDGNLFPSGKATAPTLFFGMTKTQYWTEETKTLFKNSLNWLKTGEDLDGDGYFSGLDCNDHDSSTYPGASEIPYDGKDQDCSGSDLVDVDEDNFNSTIVGGLDCNDLDSAINPSNPDPYNNCINDAPILENIPSQTYNEGDIARIVVNAVDPENNTIIYSINDSRFTLAGNTFSWQTSYDNEGRYNVRITATDGTLSSSKTASLEIRNKNRPPVSAAIPNISWNEDTNYSLNLSNYFSDTDSDSLIFGVADSSSDSHISLYSLVNGTASFSVQQDWNGQDWIIFFAFDGSDMTNSNKVTLNVLPVNDAPIVLSQIPNITWNEDTNYSLNLSNYFSDVEGNLSYTISGNSNITASFGNNVAVLFPTKDYNGEETATLTASDGQFTIQSNQFSLKVLPRDEPPEFATLNCPAEITEDEQSSCTLDATDLENDSITFSAISAGNLTCQVSNNTLSYISKKDYTGSARCELLASDKDGSTSLFFNVNILPVNDAPVIKSFLPEGVVRVLAGTEKLFSIIASDIDSPFSISWSEGNQSGTGASYSFNKTIAGNYNLTAVVSDSFLSTSHSWNVFVGDISAFTCSEVSGNICNEKQICPSEILGVKDTKSCCSVACIAKPPTFEDANACSPINSTLKIRIKDPVATDEFELGETISVDVELENDLNQDQSFDIEAHIYNADDETSVADESSSLDVNSDSTRSTTLDIQVPQDLDLDTNYVIFVKAEDEACNQAYIPLDLKRQREKLNILEFSIDKGAVCGDSIKGNLKIENLGSLSMDAYTILKNDKLNINQRTSVFHIGRADSNDRFNQELSFDIPDDAPAGVYPLNATVYYNSTYVSKTQNIVLGECLNEQEQEIISEPQKITLNSLSNQNVEKKTLNTTALIAVGMLFITTLVLALVLFIVLVRKRINPKKIVISKK